MASIASVFSGASGIGLLGLAAGSLLGNLFGKSESMPAPAVAKPALMPSPDDEAVRNAKRRSLAEQMQRKGRQGTILTDGADAADMLGG